MKIYSIKLSWLYGSDEASLKAITKRKELLTKLQVTLEDEDGFQAPSLIVDANQMAELLCNGQSITHCKEFNVGTDSLSTLADRFAAILKRFEALPSEDIAYNSHCEVHMPGQALATYNDTLLLEDSCTDKLQEALNTGWRIIACCPQSNSRRPDYILGRFNPTLIDNHASAKRNPKEF